MPAYLDEVFITADKGIQKKMITKGDGDKPEKGQEVTVHYQGRLENGTVFDESAKHGEPLKFRIGEGSVIEGWEKGVAEMQLGEKSDLVIKSEYAYGKMGSPPTIPGDATLIFTVDLIAINDKRPTRWMMSDVELLKAALGLKDGGNLKFKEKKYKEAEGIYNDAIGHIEHFKNQNDEADKLKVILYQNCATSVNYCGDYANAISLCTKAIAVNDKSWKAWYQRGLANCKLHNYEESLSDIKAAIKLEPANKVLRAEFEKVKAERKQNGLNQ